MKDKNLVKITYSINSVEENFERKLALQLFDMLDFKQNIVLQVLRAYNNFEQIVYNQFKEEDFKLIKNFSCPNSYCLIISNLNSNQRLFDLINAMDTQTEWEYVPNVLNLKELLYNIKSCKKEVLLSDGIISFESYFDFDSDLNFYFNMQYFKEKNIDKILNEWENQFKNLIQKKKIKYL